MRRIAIAALVTGGCRLLPHGYQGPVAPRVPGALTIQPVSAGVAGSCTASTPNPIRDPRWKPRTEGELELVDVRGEPRLTVDRSAIPAWSRDGAFLATADRTAVTVWRANDGALADVLTYPAGPLSVTSIAISPDRRWIVVDGTHETSSSKGITIAFERRGAGFHPRTLDRSLGTLSFGGDTSKVRGTAGDLDLVMWKVSPPSGTAVRGGSVRRSKDGHAIERVDSSGQVRRLTEIDPLSDWTVTNGGARVVVARPGKVEIYAMPEGTLVHHFALPGTEHVTISRDGRRVAGWTLARVRLLGTKAGERPPPPRPVPAQPQPFLAVWDVASERQLWRDNGRCCERWTFSDDGDWLEPPLGRLGSELVHAPSGRIVTFPGRVLPVSPRGGRVPVLNGDGIELWSTTGVRKIAPPRTGTVVARGSTGAFVVHRAKASALGHGIETELGQGADELVAGPQCSVVFPRGGDDDRFAFSPDGTELYAVHPTHDATEVGLWDTSKGQRIHALRATAHHQITPMPTVGRFAFEVEAGVRIVDARTGRELAAAPAPRVTYSDGPGLVWDVRDPDGERTSTLGFVSASPDGRELIGSTTLQGEVVTIWKLANPDATIDLPVPDTISALAISPRGTVIAAGTRDGRTVVWARPGRDSRTVARAGGWTRTLAFSSDGALLATGSDDGIVRVVSPKGAPIGTLALVADRPMQLTWSDPHTLVIDTARHLVVTVRVRPRERSPSK